MTAPGGRSHDHGRANEVLAKALFVLIIAVSGTQTSLADVASLPDDHAPIAVTGDHTHNPGEIMFSYRYGRMKMEGNRDGTDDVSVSDVHEDFMVAPTDMTVDMHMFGVMYGTTERLTLMATATYLKKSMNLVTRTGVEFKTEASGFADTKVVGMFRLYDSVSGEGTNRRGSSVHANVGLSFPTGSTDEHDATPMTKTRSLPDAKLPYPMQTGSGTFDPVFALTWQKKYPGWSIGTQAGTTVRLGENDEGYTLGDKYEASCWAAINLNEHASVSLRLRGETTGNINGRDDDLNVALVPTARPDLRGGKKVGALVGFNLLRNEGSLSGHRLAVEFGLPLYQDLDGPQLKSDYNFVVGWQWTI